MLTSFNVSLLERCLLLMYDFKSFLSEDFLYLSGYILYDTDKYLPPVFKLDGRT